MTAIISLHTPDDCRRDAGAGGGMHAIRGSGPHLFRERRRAGFSIALDGVRIEEPRAPEVILGARPYDIALTHATDGDAQARVEVVEPLGPVTLGHLRIDRLTGQLARVVTPAETPVRVGDTYGIRLRRNRRPLFDASTGRRWGL